MERLETLKGLDKVCVLLPHTESLPSGSLPAEGLSLTSHLGNPCQPGHCPWEEQGLRGPEMYCTAFLTLPSSVLSLALLAAK